MQLVFRPHFGFEPCCVWCLAHLVALKPRRAFVSRTITLAWLAPYALVGVAFFPSDPERWLFVLPLLWLSSFASAERARLAVATPP